MTLTDTDLKNVKELVKVSIDEDETLARKEDLKHLPTKNQFYEKIDEIVGELKGIREELPIINHQISNHEDRIDNIEKKLQIKTSFT